METTCVCCFYNGKISDFDWNNSTAAKHGTYSHDLTVVYNPDKNNLLGTQSAKKLADWTGKSPAAVRRKFRKMVENLG